MCLTRLMRLLRRIRLLRRMRLLRLMCRPRLLRARGEGVWMNERGARYGIVRGKQVVCVLNAEEDGARRYAEGAIML